MMSFNEILYVHRAWLRSRVVLVQELLAVVGISVGVALLFASQVASTSLDSSVRELTNRVVGSTQLQLDSRGAEGFSERLIARVQRLPGVKVALPLLEQPATVIGPKGEASVDLLGADPRFARSGGGLLRRFSARQLAHQEAIALPASVAASVGVGSLEPIKVQIGARVKESVVGATLGKADIGGLAQSQIAFAPVAYAQKLAGAQGRITRVFIQTRHGHEAQAKASLERLAAREDLNLAPANFDSRLFAVASAPAQQGEGLFSAISAIVGFLFAFNAMLLTVPERRKLIEAMRRRGTTRSMTVQLLCWEAAVIGVLAGAIGLALGELLSVQVFHSEPGYLSFAFPVGSQRLVTWPTVALALGAGMLAAFVGVLAPLRVILARPLRSAAAAERAPRGWTPLRIGAGALGLAITTLILVVRPQAAVLGNFTLIVALMCLRRARSRHGRQTSRLPSTLICGL